MPSHKILFFISFIIAALFSKANSSSLSQQKEEENIEMVILCSENIIENSSRPHPTLHLFKRKRELGKKYTAALLAFPFPFGIVGLHRIYLGCAPYVPVVYIASLGGAFGMLPLIDCCIILADKDTEKYVNNKKVFMWIE